MTVCVCVHACNVCVRVSDQTQQTYLACQSFEVTCGVDSALFTIGPSIWAETRYDMSGNLSKNTKRLHKMPRRVNSGTSLLKAIISGIQEYSKHVLSIPISAVN